ncbi:T9SS type B sorting domain-containing protein [Psychroserpens sp. SPM9]|uniref:T9SS type B sorting domain-containing protein n=1 Tax=Psychroserpens sp. SPM9 TaxID=2975598 RepID=UPI0021A4B7C1|nr:T9SS type B sorting domain-containing protein [Psychroserpens sp. SPM9]MDG5492731.1 T9SS type B sorting domain-containing protein [Psychroserpens sp. SPM9]
MKFKYVFMLVFIFSFTEKGNTQNVPPTITAEGVQEFCGNAPMPIVTSVSISDPDAGDDTLDNVFIQISEGYTLNQDLLVLNGTYPNITSSWSAVEGKLTLEGPASFTAFVDAISNVTFQTTQTNFTEDKLFSINLGDANFLPSTGHYYLYVTSDGVTWTAARDAAEDLNYFGLQGYLATLTTEEESQFAGEQSLGTGWIGASDAASEGDWTWVTGPEANTLFWTGAVNGQPVNDEYSFWNTGEPNNFNNEDYAHITDPSIGNIGSWNDLPNAGDPGGPSSPYYPRGFFVEFGGMPDDPDVNLSASTIIITPKLVYEDLLVCDQGDVTIAVTSNTNTVLWYETPSSSVLLNSGLTYSTFLETTTTFWVLPLFDGCTSGPRTPITVSVPDLPQANAISIRQCDDTIQDGISVFNLDNYFEEITGNITENRTVNFFEDASLLTEINGSNFSNTSNPQTLYALVVNTETGCSNSAEVVLEVVVSSNENSALLEVCDDLVEDGFVTFDLSMASDQILLGAPIDATVNYYETYEDASLEVNSLPLMFFNTVAHVQTIYARVNNNTDCYGINEVTLVVKELPQLSDTFETIYYCLNTYPETITLSGGIVNAIPNNYYYNWSTGETTMSIEVNETGTYTVEVTEPDGCSNLRTIQVLPSNIATIESVVVQDLSSNNSISILVSGEGDYEYALNSITGPFQSSNTFEFLEAGIYTVYIRDIKNDCGSVVQDVSVIGYPKFFTPNGDGYHDTWKLKGISEQFQPHSKVYIFDRFGKLIYTLNSPSDAWDGTFNGKALPTSDYWFSVTLEDGRVFKNHFTLKR